MESKFHELKNRLLKNIDQTSESRLYMDIQLAQNCETLMSIIKKDIGYLAKEGILAEGDSVVGVSGYHASVKASGYATVVNMNCPNIDLRDNTRLWLPARGSFAARKNCDIIVKDKEE